MNEIERKILIGILIEQVKTNAMVESLVSVTLDELQKEEFNDKAGEYRQERLKELFLRLGEFFSDDDKEFLRSAFE